MRGSVELAGPCQPEPSASQSRLNGLGWLGFLGPAFAVSLGYIDPGNWATDLAASADGCRLLWVVLTASAIALILQIGSAQLAVVTCDDLASLISRRWPRAPAPLGALFELAVIAIDVAGIVVGLRLLFHLPITVAALLSVAVVAVIFLFNAGRLRRLELALILMLALVGAGVLWETWRLRQPLTAIAAGAIIPRMPDSGRDADRNRDHRRDRHAAQPVLALSADEREIPRRKRRCESAAWTLVHHRNIARAHERSDRQRRHLDRRRQRKRGRFVLYGDPFARRRYRSDRLGSIRCGESRSGVGNPARAALSQCQVLRQLYMLYDLIQQPYIMFCLISNL
jgi:hypothetical protein